MYKATFLILTLLVSSVSGLASPSSYPDNAGAATSEYGAIKDYMQVGFSENASGKEAATKQLLANAEAIADFLDAANPHLPKEAVLPLLSAHGGHHLQQIDAVHARDFGREAVVWDAMLGHTYAIADAMASALARQFPEIVTG